MKKIFYLIFFVILIQIGGAAMALELKSSAFENGDYIPEKFTGEGPDVSPALTWSNAPEGTKGFALICDDPDAPVGTWVHWVIYDIPSEIFSLDEGIPRSTTFSNGIKQGVNDFRNVGYGGPMPPPGKAHRYFFKIYALDEKLDLEPKLTKKGLLETIEGHVLETAELIGLYKR